MKKIAFVFLISVLSIFSYADDIFKTDSEFSDFFTYYYLNPQIEKIIPSLNYYVDSAAYEKVNARMTIAHFYAHILKDNPDLLNELFENQSQFGISNSKIFTLNVLWLINSDMSKNLIEKAKEIWLDETVQDIIKKIQNASVYNVLEKTPKTAVDLDNLWGIFLATGDEAAVKRIISALHLKEEGHGMEIVIGGAAEWSLASNAMQHEKVLDIIKSEVKVSTGTTKRLLEKILIKCGVEGWSKDGELTENTENIKAEKGFGAQLWLIDDEKFFDDWLKPETPRIRPVKSIKRNKPIFAIVLFVNPGLNEKNYANVTCDVLIKDPNGNVYEDAKDIEVWQNKPMHAKNQVQLAVSNVGIIIEDDDPLGKYAVEAIVKDNIKNVRLPLYQEFETIE